MGLGCTYYKKGESWYDEAMKSHQKALKLLCATGKSEHPSVGNAYEGMANVYFSQQKFDLAFDYYHKSIAVASNVCCPPSQVFGWVAYHSGMVRGLY